MKGFFEKNIENNDEKIFNEKDFFNKEELKIIIWEHFFKKIGKIPKKLRKKLTRLSINPERLEIFMMIALWLINNIWEIFFQENLWTDFQKPELVFFEWSIDINWKKFSWEAGFDTNTNKILINSSLILWLVDFDAIKSDIWFTLIIAHEVWHSIQKQLLLLQSREDKEHHADFIAGYTLKEMEKMWLLDEQDLEEALFTFGRFWDICELSRTNDLINQKTSTNIWWDNKKRKWNLFRWYSANKKEVLETLKTKIEILLKEYNNIILKNVA